MAYRNSFLRIFPHLSRENLYEKTFEIHREYRSIAPIAGNFCFEKLGDGFLPGIFPDAKVIGFYGCDKNFSFYNLNPDKFPNAQIFMIFGNPGDYRVQYRLRGKRVIVPEEFKSYFQDIPHYVVKNEQELLEISAVMGVCDL